VPDRLFSFWTGRELTYLEHLCLKSMINVGHEVVVYTYNSVLDVPDGVIVKNASDILPSPPPKLVEAGRWAFVADIFRYLGLEREIGIWVDLDIFLLKNLDNMGSFIYGWQEPGIINSAVLKLPPKSKPLQQLIAISRDNVVVGPHWSLKHRLYQIAMGAAGMHTPLEKLEWGVIGPHALTKYLTESRLLHHCQPVDVFYPVEPLSASIIFDDNSFEVENRITSSTRALHLWNELIRNSKKGSPPMNSFIGKMCKRLNIKV
jgi:hypothetical protein